MVSVTMPSASRPQRITAPSAAVGRSGVGAAVDKVVTSRAERALVAGQEQHHVSGLGCPSPPLERGAGRTGRAEFGTDTQARRGGDDAGQDGGDPGAVIGEVQW